MNRPAAIILVCLTALNCSASSNGLGLPSTAVELAGKFNPNDLSGASGLVEVQSGPFSITAGRGKSGKVGAGVGLYDAGTWFFGNYGKVSAKAASTLDGMYRVVFDTELFAGTNTYNPLTVTVTRKNHGIEYSGQSELGLVGGSFITSTESDAKTSFEVHMTQNGWVSAVANGTFKDSHILIDSYNAGFNLGLVSGALNMNGDRAIQAYEIGGSLGLIHGSVKIDKANHDQKTYRAGVSLGVISFDTVITGSKKGYNAVLDAGLLQFKYNVDMDDKSYWKGSVDLANIGVDYEVTKEGVTIAGGRIQLGPSLINIHRDSKGEYVVKVNHGTTVE